METGLLPEAAVKAASLSSRARARLEALERFDLSAVTANLVDKGRRFSPEQVWPLKEHFGYFDGELAQALEREFRRFIALTMLKPGTIYAPSGPVDMYWHFFVLHTREYAAFCEDVWGSNHGRHGYLDEEETPEASRLHFGDPSTATLRIVPKALRSELSDDVLHRLAVLEMVDISFVAEDLVDRDRAFAPEQIWPIKAHFGRADREISALLETEFRKFVALTLINPDATFAPSGPVDMFWHFFILHSQEYREFCDAVWGRFQHHPRGSGTDAPESKGAHLPHSPSTHGDADTEQRFQALLITYEEVFGPANPQVWTSPTQEV